MKLDPYIADIRADLAFLTDPDDPSPAYVDVTDYVVAAKGIGFGRARVDEFAAAMANICALTFDNTTGFLSPDYSGSPWYPNVEVLRKLQISARVVGVLGNGLADPSFEGATIVDWVPGGSPLPPPAAISAVRSHSGSQSMLITWAAGSTLFPGQYTTLTCVIGRTYSAWLWVWVPTGNPAVRLLAQGSGLLLAGTASATTNAWELISVTFVARSQTHTVSIGPSSAPTAGQQCFADDARWDEGSTDGFTTTPLSGTAASPIFYRYTGYLNDLPTVWPGGGVYSEVAITAVDRFSRIGDDAELRSMLEEEISSDSPFAYYTLAESAGATMAGDTSTNGRGSLSVAQLGVGGALSFAAGTGPGSDGLPAPMFAPASTTNGKYLLGALNAPTSLFGGHTVDVFFLTSVSAVQTMALATGIYGGVLQLGIDGSGKLQGVCGFGGLTLTSPGSVADGSTHHAALVESVSGTTVTCRLYLDGAQVATGSYTSAYGVIRTISTLAVGGGNGTVFNGTLAHAAVFDSPLAAARIADHAAGSVGFSGEGSAARLGRLGRYAGIPASEMLIDVGVSTSIQAVNTAGASPLSAMQAVEETEGGVLFLDGRGRLVGHARSRRYNIGASVLTVQGEDVDAGLAITRNRAYLVNDVTASRAGGITFRAVNQASINRYGRRGKSVSLLTTSDLEVIDAANWKANATAQLTSRFSALQVELLTNPNIAAGIGNILMLDVSSRISTAALPATAPVMTDQFVEGWAETINESSWQMAFNTSPALQSSVWQLDSATHSQLDSTTRLGY